MRRMNFLSLVVISVVLSLASISTADTYLFVDVVDNDIGNTSNWDQGSLPGSSDTAYIKANSYGVNNGTDLNVQQLIVWKRHSDNGPTKLINNSGNINSSFAIMVNTGSTFEVNGGSVYSGARLILGNNDGAGTFDVTGGTHTFAGNLDFGAGYDDLVSVTGGTVNFGGIKMADWESGDTLYMEAGGTVNFAGDWVTWIDTRLGGPRFQNDLGGAADTWDLSYDGSQTTLTVVPEPATVGLLGLGLVFFRRKRK